MKKLLKISAIAFGLTAVLLAVSCGEGKSKKIETEALDYTLSLDDIVMRDPCILPVAETGTYYMYGSMNGPGGRAGMVAYRSKDLKNWAEPIQVLEVPADIWANAEMALWAPEVHKYKGKYYAFATLHNDRITLGEKPTADWPGMIARRTHIFVSDSPEGPFVPLGNTAQTPAEWMSLDGTLWVEDGIPYMIFCHEWVQTGDGTMDYVRLTDDLSEAVGEPHFMFRAGDASWSKSIREDRPGIITDGCYLYRTGSGELIMIWSSFCDTEYAVGTVRSESGTVAGPWKHDPEMIFSDNGGHAMIFRDFDGRLMLTLHQPNGGGPAHPKIFELEDTGDNIRIK